MSSMYFRPKGTSVFPFGNKDNGGPWSAPGIVVKTRGAQKPELRGDLAR